MLFGAVIGVFSQSFSLQRFAQETATVSKMDWILLNSRVRVLEELVRDDLSVPLVPTSYSFDKDDERIRIAVKVDPTWLGRSNLSEAKSKLTSRAQHLCLAPWLSEHGQFGMLFLEKAPVKLCRVIFFTPQIDKSGKSVVPKDVAVYENGELVLK